MSSLVLAACTLAAASQPAASQKNIAELAESSPELIFLSTLLKSAGLTGALSGPGPFTVLAPRNDAFDTLDVNDLLDPANKKRLQKILEFHVVKGSLYPDTFKKGIVDTLEGAPLEVFERIDQGQIRGTYIGPPKTNPLDVSDAFKVRGYHASPYVNASNGVVYLVGAVILPPNTTAPKLGPKPSGEFSGCTKDSCIFKVTTKPSNFDFGCCGEVDAAPRMPPSIFNDTVALAEYVRLTEQLSGFSVLHSRLVNQKCTVVPSYVRNGTKTYDWFEGFKPWCEARCGCGGLFHPCKDVPDEPAKHKYCSLCGPKYNAPIEVQLYKVKGHQGYPQCAQ